jgi:hypothetical protein
MKANKTRDKTVKKVFLNVTKIKLKNFEKPQ